VRSASSTPTTTVPAPPHPDEQPQARTPAEREFPALGPVAEQFLVGAATAGVTELSTEIAAILTLPSVPRVRRNSSGFHR
jgi:hypothetical protein